MLSPSANLRVYLCMRPVDLRFGFDRLAELVRQGLTLDPLCGHLFAFKNKRGDRLKVLYWEPSGYCLWYKRLEAGTFAFPLTGLSNAGEVGLEIRPADLVMLIEGVDLARVRRRTRYHKPAD